MSAAEPAAGAGISDIDAAMAWLEGLAARQGAEEATLSTTAEQRLEAPPEWVAQELEKAQAGTEEVPVSQMPVEAAAQAQDASEQIPAPVEAAPVEIQAPPAEGISAAIPPVSETVPSEAPEAAVSPQQVEEDAAFAWLESLAARQGADEGTLVTPEGERPTQAPSWVIEQAAAEPGLTDASELLEGTLPGVEAEAPQKEEAVPEAVELKPEWAELREEAAGGTPETQEPTAVAPETGEWVAELPQQTEVESAPAVELPAVEAEGGPVETEEPLPSWLQEFEPSAAQEVKEVAPASEGELPDWLKGFETPAEAPITQASDESISVSTWLKEEAPVPAPAPVGEPELTPPTPQPAPQVEPEPAPPQPAASILGEGLQPESGKAGENPLLVQAQTDLRNGNTASASNIFGQLIEGGQNLDEIIQSVQESLYRYPVDISLWQTLGDAYMRSNRIQEALDAYTKAEELLK